MERSSNLQWIPPTLPRFWFPVGRIAASFQECGTGQSGIPRGPFPIQPRFAGERLGDGSFQFLGGPQHCPESCTSGCRKFQGSVPNLPRFGWLGSCQQIAGCCTSERRNFRGFVPIQPKLQKGKKIVIRYTSARRSKIIGKESYFGLEGMVEQEREWSCRSQSW